MADIGKNIRHLRIQKHMTQDELAERLFVSRQTVSNYETGKSNPDIDMLLKIAEVFQTDVTVLIFGTSDMAERRKDVRKLAAAGAFLAVLVLFYRYTGSWQQALIQQYYDYGLGYFMHFILLPILCLLAGWLLAQLMKLFLKARKLSGKAYTAVFYIFLALMLLYFMSIFPLCMETGITSLQYVLRYAENSRPYISVSGLYVSFPFFLHMWSSNVCYWILDRSPLFFCGAWLLGGMILWNGPGKHLSFRREKSFPG